MEKFKASFTPQFLKELDYWQDTNLGTYRRIQRLIADVAEDPFHGIGKPKLIKDCWSRRITQEHRLVYAVDGRGITFLQCRYNYR